MANRNVIIQILGDDKEFQSALSRVKRGVGDLSSLNSKVNVALGAIGAGFSLGAVIDENEKFQASQAQLHSALSSTGDKVGYSAEQLTAYAEALQQVSNYSRDDIVNTEALLLQYTHIGHDIFPQVVKTTLDLAQRMGVDLPTAAREVGRALDDPVKGMNALTRAGITFSNSQKQQITFFAQSNQLAKAQAVILGSLEQKFGGAAAAARDTLGGAITAVKHNFEELLDTDSSTSSDLKESVNELAKTLNDPQVKAGFQAFVDFLAKIAEYGAKSVGVFAMAGKLLGEGAAHLMGNKGSLDDQMYDLDDQLADKRGQMAMYQRNGTTSGVAYEALKKEIADLQAQQQALTKLVDQTSYHGTQGTAPGGAAPSSTKDTGAAGADVINQAQLNYDRLKGISAAALAQLDQQYKEHLISIGQYYAERVATEQKAIDAEIQLDKKKLAAAGDDAAKQTQIQGEIIELEQKRKQVAVEAATAQAEAEKKLAEQLDGVKVALERAQGQEVAATRDELNKQYEELLAKMKAEGNTAGIEIINKLINVDVARAQLQELEDAVTQAQSDMQAKIAEYNSEEQSGALTQQQAQQKIAEAQKQTLATTQQLIPQMQELAQTIGDPKAVDQVDKLSESMDKLQQQTNQWVTQLTGAAETDLSNFFYNLEQHSESTKQAFSDMLKSFLDTLERMADEIEAKQIITSFLAAVNNAGASGSVGDNGGGGSDYTDMSTGESVTPVYASGGPVYGPGTATSDSIDAKLSAGEWVIKAASVQKYGHQMLDAINRGMFPHLVPSSIRSGQRRFADGGFVGAGFGDQDVNVHNYTSAPTNISRDNKNGRRQLNIMVGSAAASDILGGGQLAKAIEASYGLTRQAAQRG